MVWSRRRTIGLSPQSHRRSSSAAAATSPQSQSTASSWIPFAISSIAALANALDQERAALKPLPSTRYQTTHVYDATVRKWSTIHFWRRTYSVPSRLIGCAVQVRQHADIVEVYYRGKLTASMPRLRGERHTASTTGMSFGRWCASPGRLHVPVSRGPISVAHVSARLRRAAQMPGERADIEYVRILHLAASTLQSDVEQASVAPNERGVRFDYAAVEVARRA